MMKLSQVGCQRKQLGQCIAEIYHCSQGSSFSDFQVLCYRAIHDFLPLGRCSWSVGGFDEVDFSVDNAVRFLTGSEIVEQYNDGPDFHCGYQSAGLVHKIVFRPFSKNTLFTEDSCSILLQLVPHLVESFRLNVLSAFKKQWHQNLYHSAVFVIGEGFISVDDGFCQSEALTEYLSTASSGVSDNGFPRTNTRLLIEPQRLYKIEPILDSVFILLLAFPEKLTSLTDKEKEICFYLLQPLSNAMIGQQLGISLKTVENHLANIFLKTGISSRAKLIASLRVI